MQLDNQRKLNEEKRKCVLLEDEVSFLKTELEKRKAEIKAVTGEKDSLIIDMKREMSNMSRPHINSMISQQSPIRLAMDQSMNASRDFQMGYKQIMNVRSISPNGGNTSGVVVDKSMFGGAKICPSPRNDNRSVLANKGSSNALKQFGMGNSAAVSQQRRNLSKKQMQGYPPTQSTTAASQLHCDQLMQSQTMQMGGGYHKLTTAELQLYQSC